MIRAFGAGGRFDLKLRGYQPHEADLAAAVEAGISPGLIEIESAVILSLYTDRTAEPGDLPAFFGADDLAPFGRGGWWAAPEAGSLLWTFRRRSISERGLTTRIADEARAALLWMEGSGMAVSGSVKTAAFRNRMAANRIDLEVSVTEPRSRLDYSRRFSIFWGT